MSNILKAILNIYNCSVFNTVNDLKAKNRANSMGDALEHFIKDSFANSYNYDIKDAVIAHSNVFSYLGNQNNPPDMILKNGDAIEVKKIENYNSALALNSSYPKTKIYYDSSMITSSCKNCEGYSWQEKDLIYAVGIVKDDNIRQLCFVYGDDYSAEKSIYERIKTKIKDGVMEIRDVDFSETNELGRVNRVDPLGITYLRIRGMWHIENPFKVFNYVVSIDKNKEFNFMAIINKEKFESFAHEDKNALTSLKDILIKDIKIKNPNNPAILRDGILISFSR